MKIAFLILAHKNPKQLVNLVKELTHESTSIFIHIDKKSDLNEFEKEFKDSEVTPDTIIQEIDIIYSSITYIDATLLLINEAIKKECNYFVLLSGLDLPLKPIGEIVKFYTQNSTKDFFDFVKIPYNKLGYEGRTRTEFYNFKIGNQMETLFPLKEINHEMSWKGKILNYFLLIKNWGKSKRSFPLEMTPYYSSQWWNLSLESIEYIIAFLKKNPIYYNYHKNALHPEEMFFQSIILNSNTKNNVTNDNLRYIRWKEGKKHPELIDINEVKEISESTEHLFARKFNLNY